jgi:hypothetical protein
MDCHSANSLAKRNKVMSPEQFNQVVEAITEGRYSWACVLILRFAGYNPVYFIPYRTYSRLVKENQFLKNTSDVASHSMSHTSQRQPRRFSTVSIGDLSTMQSLSSEENLTSIETAAQSEANLHGGTFVSWLGEVRENSICRESLPFFQWR